MPDLITPPAPPSVSPNVTTPILVVNEYVVAAGETRYTTTLPVLFDQNSGWDGSDLFYILRNAGTIWNESQGNAYILDVNNWGSIYNSGIIVARGTGAQAQTIVIGGHFTNGLYNSGSIYAVSDTYFASALELWSPEARISNSGTIAAKTDGGAIAIRAFNGAEIINEAGGSILAEGGATFAVIAIDIRRGGSHGAGFTDSGADVTNHGLIEARSHGSQPSIAITIANLWNERIIIDNHGVIRADVAIYSNTSWFTPPQHAPQVILNRAGGLIDGDIDVDLGNDTLVNDGQIIGLTDMGDGHDIVISQGSISGQVLLGAGNDMFDGRGGALNGQVQGQDGADLLIGSAGQDNLSGGAGDDVLVGGGGDTLFGGAGRDIFKFGTIGGPGEIVGDFTSGTDVIDLRALAPNSVTINGSTISVTTSAGGLTIQVNGTVSASDILTGSVTSLVGTSGDDALVADNDGATLDGGAGADLLVGGDGNDVLYGGAGADMLWGGAGDDVYVVDVSDNPDGIGDTPVEAAGEGVDTVQSSASHSLGLHIENLTLTGNLPVDGYGNDLHNVMVGNAMANYLRGGAGNDTLRGGLSSDFLKGGSGADLLVGDDGSDFLEGGSGEDVFIGTAAGLNGDHLLDIAPGESIVITDVNLTDFSHSLSMSASGGYSGRILTYTGGALKLPEFTGHFAVSAAVNGGVRLTAIRDVADDFNGDGHSDILWRDDNGQMTNWLGQANGGFSYNDANARNMISTDWHIAGIGDFNGDGLSDILWRNDSGLMTNWLGQANGGFIYNDANARNDVSTDWQIAGVGDFNGDHRDDILWRRDNGQLTNWLGQANGGFSYNDANALNHVATDWDIAAVGDFNGDNRDDILWRNENGQMTNWLGQVHGGFYYNDAAARNMVATDWHIAGVGDFNGDGQSDILWRNDTGLITNWLGTGYGGFTYNDANARNHVATDWEIASIADFDGDGRDDIVWRRDNGQMTNWLGQANGGFSYNDANALNQIATDWHIQAPDILLM